MTDVDAHGNRPDTCGHCTLLPSVSGWVRATQTRCPEHGDPPRRLRTEAERHADGTAWRAAAHSRPGYATYPDTPPFPGQPDNAPATGDFGPVPEPPRPPLLAVLWWWICQAVLPHSRPPRRRWWHRYTRRTR